MTKITSETYEILYKQLHQDNKLPPELGTDTEFRKK